MTKTRMTPDDYKEVAAKTLLATAAVVPLIAAVRPRALLPLTVGLLAGYTCGAASGIGFGPGLLEKKAAAR